MGKILKRKGLFIPVILVLLIGLVSCRNGSRDDGDYSGKGNGQHFFIADVIEANGGLLIAPDKDSSEALSADRIMASVGEAEITDSKGNAVSLDMLEPGDRIKVTYDGLIAESYPAQIKASRIEVLGRNNVIDGFLSLIDDIYQADSGLNGNISIIAFDTSEWAMLTEIETEIILDTVGEKYGFEVVVGTFDELAGQGLIDKENLFFEDGILITIADIEINKDKDVIECSIEKWRSGLGAVGWDAKAKLKKGSWRIIRKNMWIS